MNPGAPLAGPRLYEARAETTATFGRVSCAVRHHRLTVQRKCPVYGSLAVASGRIEVHHETEPEVGG